MTAHFTTPQAVAALLATTPTVVTNLCAGLDDALLSWRPAPNEWCIKEVIGHLLAMDTLAFGDRIRLILSEDTPAMPGVDEKQIAIERRDNERPISELLADFARERETAVSYLQQLPTDQLHRTGTFPVDRHFRASDFLYEWPYHDYDHIKQISDIIQDAAWPHLSETMQKALRR
ncbi:MAG: DinB family protein [Chloroflexota bacterium]